MGKSKLRNRSARQHTVEEISERIAEENRAAASVIRHAQQIAAEHEWAQLEMHCGTVPSPLSADLAHELIQLHRRCKTELCPCRQAALEVLREEGRYVPAKDFDRFGRRRS